MEVPLKRLVIAFISLFLLGAFFSIINGYYATDEGNPLPILVYAISFLSILVGAGIVALFQWKINKMQIERMLKILPGEERVVIKILLDHNYEIEQNKLVALSGYTKVKISRIIKQLELRKVVTKNHLGNTNLIRLEI